MRRLACAIALAIVLSGCAYGRSPTELASTPFGRMLAPAGSALAWELYVPPKAKLDGVRCALLERLYASNDIVAFFRAFSEIAARSGGTWVGYTSDRPTVSSTSDGPTYQILVDGTSVGLSFYDLDRPGTRPPAWIDASAWRYVVQVWIWDRHRSEGGGCK